MVALWYQNHPENYEIQSEKKAIAKAFEHFAAIGMDGLMLLDGLICRTTYHWLNAPNAAKE